MLKHVQNRIWRNANILSEIETSIAKDTDKDNWDPFNSLQTDLNICKEEISKTKERNSYIKKTDLNRKKKVNKQTQFRSNNESLEYIS